MPHPLHFCSQLMVYATDSGYPPRNTTQEARITLRITRNRYTPQFTLSTYVASIPETLQIGGSVLDIMARDDDSEVGAVWICPHPFLFIHFFIHYFILSSLQGAFSRVSYRIIGDDTASQYFSIQPETGRISVKSDLRAENIEFYSVSGVYHLPHPYQGSYITY